MNMLYFPFTKTKQKTKKLLSRNTGIQEIMWKYLQFERLVVNSQQES